MWCSLSWNSCCLPCASASGTAKPLPFVLACMLRPPSSIWTVLSSGGRAPLPRIQRALAQLRWPGGLRFDFRPSFDFCSRVSWPYPSAVAVLCLWSCEKENMKAIGGIREEGKRKERVKKSLEIMQQQWTPRTEELLVFTRKSLKEKSLGDNLLLSERWEAFHFRCPSPSFALLPFLCAESRWGSCVGFLLLWISTKANFVLPIVSKNKLLTLFRLVLRLAMHFWCFCCSSGNGGLLPVTEWSSREKKEILPEMTWSIFKSRSLLMVRWIKSLHSSGLGRGHLLKLTLEDPDS